MVSKTEEIFIDSSWFKALADPSDDFAEDAADQHKVLKKEGVQLFTTNFILDESYTLIRVKVDLPSALDFRKMLVSMDKFLTLVRVLPQDEEKAWKWFPEKWSKLSFTDCTSFAVMERLGLKKVATFDKHFAKAGYDVLSS